MRLYCLTMNMHQITMKWSNIMATSLVTLLTMKSQSFWMGLVVSSQRTRDSDVVAGDGHMSLATCSFSRVKRGVCKELHTQYPEPK